MSKAILKTCEKLYGTKDLYTLFGVEKKASEQEIKKAYYRLSMKTHPDRVPEEDKKNATERFKVLSKLYGVLTDKDKRAIYDERGIVDDDGEDGEDILKARWHRLFTPLTVEEIDDFKKTYIGSELERNDIKKAYLNGRGCINYMNQMVPFMSCEDEPRVAQIVQELIDAQEVPAYDAFLKEPKAKRDRRHKKYAREAKEADKMKREKREDDSEMASLQKQIALRNTARKSAFESMIDSLVSRYGDEDGSQEFESPKRKRANSKKSADTKPQTTRKNKSRAAKS
ncbi:J domain-containing protein CG6693 [Anopheles bellator]|uniref:J domain-containing protein CG6693 n=1 Tax=Anopheles bellator TaxID=139047 RepID=UPI0026488E7D|nr:J domain-containing protein CG6693 [Anopheles bellator]